MKVAESPRGRVAIVSLIVPVPPTAGPVRVKGRPEVCVSETNVVSAGRGSGPPRLASLGPVFKTVIVYVISLPASMGPAALVFVTVTSASPPPGRRPGWYPSSPRRPALMLDHPTWLHR